MKVESPMIFRVDAGERIGAGHAMRCLALAQAWQDSGCRAVFMMSAPASQLEQRLQSEGIEIIQLKAAPGTLEDAAETAEIARTRDASSVVIDGYHFGPEYRRIVKTVARCLLLIDDCGCKESHADVILNQNLQAHKDLYPETESHTRLLLGPRYTLLRREFLRWQNWKPEISEVATKVLVVFGGSDPDNTTLQILRALDQIRTNKLEVVAVCGGLNPNYESLRAASKSLSVAVRLVTNTIDMPELLAWADIAISAAGTTSWELAFMGLPAILYIQADNQSAVATRLGQMGVALNLGRSADFSAADFIPQFSALISNGRKRSELSRAGQLLVDGRGASRVVQNLDETLPLLRRAEDRDCQLIWQWVNDPTTRTTSFTSDLIPWDTHVSWFSRKLRDTNCIFYIATNGGEIPIGQIRYDVEKDSAVVSVSVAPEHRGRGYGKKLIWLSAQELFDNSSVHTIHAYIKPTNEASITAFQNAGYRHAGETTIANQRALHLVVKRNTRYE